MDELFTLPCLKGHFFACVWASNSALNFVTIAARGHRGGVGEDADRAPDHAPGDLVDLGDLVGAAAALLHLRGELLIQPVPRGTGCTGPHDSW